MQSYIKISHLTDHDAVKNQLLEKIKLSDGHKIDKQEPLHQFDNADKINKTDYWFDNRQFEYILFVYPLLDKHLHQVFSETTANSVSFTKIWFQQYKKGNLHGWHTHPNTHFTNIYYLELPSKEYKTQIKNLDGSYISYDINEGDIITFPGFLSHQSPMIDTDQRKTIISCNIELL